MGDVIVIRHAYKLYVMTKNQFTLSLFSTCLENSWKNPDCIWKILIAHWSTYSFDE